MVLTLSNDKIEIDVLDVIGDVSMFANVEVDAEDDDQNMFDLCYLADDICLDADPLLDVEVLLLNGGEKRTIKHKTHKHFSEGSRGTIVPGTNQDPSQGQTGQNGDFYCGVKQKTGGFVLGTGPGLSLGRVPVCPIDGSCLSPTPSRPKCLCLLVFSCLIESSFMAI